MGRVNEVKFFGEIRITNRIDDDPEGMLTNKGLESEDRNADEENTPKIKIFVGERYFSRTGNEGKLFVFWHN